MSTLRCEIKAIGAKGFFIETIHPTVIPRVGERVKFSDGYGIVERVTWEPETTDPKRNADMTVVVECRPEAP